MYLERYGGYKKSQHIFFHGTHFDNLRSVLKQGLITSPKKRAWETDEFAGLHQPSRQSIPNSIYVTTDLLTAINASTHGANSNNSVPLIISMTLTDRILKMDEDQIVEELVTDVYRVFDSSSTLDYLVKVYLNRDADEETFKKVVNKWATPLLNTLKHYNANSTIRQIFINKLPSMFETMLFRQAAYIAEHKEILNIPNSDVTEKNYLKLMEWVSEQARFILQNNVLKPEIGRISQDVGFSGKNKIDCIFSFPNIDSKTNKLKPVVHYGKISKKIKNIFVETEKEMNKILFLV